MRKCKVGKYSVDFKCGHTVEVNIYGEDVQKQIQYMEHNEICPMCKKAEKEAQYIEDARKAHEWAMKLGLPELTGTEKQIRWAENLRKENMQRLVYEYKFRKQIAQTEEELKKLMENMKEVTEWMKTENEAAVWIELANCSLSYYFKMIKED